MILFVRYTMETPWTLGLMGFFLIFVPVIGMWAIHKYNWQHWEPFNKNK
jgi:predicted PurR-regulated permease PerM|tara:strand:+ start:141 stop:287 length:147 start_codon:yes stop_codon:yes gene_type:complete